MASTIKITNLVDMKSQVRLVVLKEINKIVKSHLLKDIEDEIIDAILRRFRSTAIYRGIKGSYPNDEVRDYQAIFGLTDIDAREAIKEMEYIFKTYVSVDLKIEERNNKVAYIIQIKYPKLNKYFIGMPGGSYTYEHKKLTFGGSRFRTTKYEYTELEIPWMEWFIYGADVAGQVDFDINEKDFAVSRSQRAVMRRTKDSGLYWDWDGIDIAETIINDPKLKIRFLEIVNDSIRTTITNNLGNI
jgi:hypothetical protein